MFAEMLRHSDLIESLDFSALKRISMGSAIVPPELIERLTDTFKVTVRESFGLTEGGGAIRQPIDGRVPPRGSVGLIAPELEVKLVGLDGKDADEGECWIRSPYVLREYVNLPELSRERIVDGWLRTGDILRRDADGFSLLRHPDRRHVRLRRREHLPQGSRESRAQASRRRQRRGDAAYPRHQGLRTGRHGGAQEGQVGVGAGAAELFR